MLPLIVIFLFDEFIVIYRQHRWPKASMNDMNIDA